VECKWNAYLCQEFNDHEPFLNWFYIQPTLKPTAITVIKVGLDLLRCNVSYWGEVLFFCLYPHPQGLRSTKKCKNNFCSWTITIAVVFRVCQSEYICLLTLTAHLQEVTGSNILLQTTVNWIPFYFQDGKNIVGII